MTEDTIARRKFLLGAGLAGTAVATGLTQTAEAQTPAAATASCPCRRRRPSRSFCSMKPSTPSSSPRSIRSFPPTNCRRRAAIAAARSISTANSPAPGAAAPKSYRAGPYFKGKPEQGYQLPLTPAEYFVAGIAAANAWSRKTYGRDFDRLDPDKRVEALKAMEEGKAEFANFSAKRVFSPACWRSPWRGFSPTRSMAATATRRHGGCSAFPACRRPTPTSSMNIATSATSPSRNPSRISRKREADMVTRLKEVDAVTVGLGWTGAIMARELTKAGLNVVSLERGPGPHSGRGFHPAVGARRSALRATPRIDDGQFDRHDDVPQFRQRAGAADPSHRRVFAGRGRRRFRHSLGRPALALSAVGFPHPQRAHRTLWRERDSGRHDDPGLAGEL